MIFTRNVITKTSFERLGDSFRTALFYTKTLVGGYPVKKFTHKIIQNPFLAREDPELRIAYGYYRLALNNLLFMSPSDRILLNFIITRSYNNVVNELPHIFYHSKRQSSRLYTIQSEHYLNPKDYKAGDAVIHSSGKYLEFKTNNLLKMDNGMAVVKQFEHANVSERSMGLSVLYNKIDKDFYREDYVKVVTSVGFKHEDIYLILQSECASMFPTVDSLWDALQYYNVKWSVYVQEHNDYLEDHLNKVLQYTQQGYVRSEVEGLLAKLKKAKELPGSVKPGKIFKSLADFKNYDSSGNHIQVGDVEEPEDIFRCIRLV